MGNYSKHTKQNYYPKGKKVRTNKTKKLVTGQGPTLLERLAAQSNNIGTVAKSILPIALAINTEFKYFDQVGSGTAYNAGTNDAIINLTQGIAQGTTDVTRIGNSILAKNIQIKLILAQNFTATSAVNEFVRVTLLVWKEHLQINPPNAAKIFEAPANFLSGFNKDYTDQMVIIKDKVLPMEAAFNTTAAQAPKFIKIFKKLDFHQRFIDGTAAGGSVNHLYLILRGNDALSANSAIYNYYSRLNFTDN